MALERGEGWQAVGYAMIFLAVPAALIALVVRSRAMAGLCLTSILLGAMLAWEGERRSDQYG